MGPGISTYQNRNISMMSMMHDSNSAVCGLTRTSLHPTCLTLISGAYELGFSNHSNCLDYPNLFRHGSESRATARLLKAESSGMCGAQRAGNSQKCRRSMIQVYKSSLSSVSHLWAQKIIVISFASFCLVYILRILRHLRLKDDEHCPTLMVRDGRRMFPWVRRRKKR